MSNCHTETLKWKQTKDWWITKHIFTKWKGRFDKNEEKKTGIGFKNKFYCEKEMRTWERSMCKILKQILQLILTKLVWKCVMQQIGIDFELKNICNLEESACSKKPCMKNSHWVTLCLSVPLTSGERFNRTIEIETTPVDMSIEHTLERSQWIS